MSSHAAVLVMVLVVSRLVAGSTATVIVLDPDLREAANDPTGELSKQRRPLRFGSGGEAKTCEQYEAARCSAALEESESNERAVSEYVICDQLALLRHGHAAKEPGPKNRGAALSARLDLRTFPSSLRQRLDDRTFVLQKLWRPSPRTDARQAVAKSRDWKFILAVDAVMDVDKDGREDWLVSITDVSLAGSYDSRQLVIVRNPAAPGVLKAETVDRWICDEGATSGIRPPR